MSMTNSTGVKGGTSHACASCKYQRKKCQSDCLLAPFFPPDQTEQFFNVHKLFGVSNITKILKQLNPPERPLAMKTIIYQATVRKRDPVHGCLGVVRSFQAQLQLMQRELHIIRSQIFYYQQLQQQHQQLQHHQQHHILPLPSPLYHSLGEATPYENHNHNNNNGGLKNFETEFIYPPFQPCEDLKPFERFVDPFQEKQAFIDCKEAPHESSAESSLREVPTLGHGLDQEMENSPRMFPLTDAIHEQEKHCMEA